MNDSHNKTAPTYSEDAISQLPALHLLQNLGWQYLKPDEALDLLLGRILPDWKKRKERLEKVII